MKNTIVFLIFFLTVSSFCYAGVDITKSDLVYIGAFRVPHGTYGSGTFENNTSVNAQYQPLAYNPANNSLFLGQKTPSQVDAKKIGEISIPTTIVDPRDVSFNVESLTSATCIQNIADISGGTFDNIRSDGAAPADEAKAQLGGLLVYDGVLYGTVWSYFDSSGYQGDRSHWYANTDWSGGYGFHGIYTVGETLSEDQSTGGIVGGWMLQVPAEYVSAIGYPLLCGRTGGPIISRSSYGPTLWGYNPANFDYDNLTPATVFIAYTDAHQTLNCYCDTASLYYNRSTGIQGAIWPDGADSILCFGATGLGIEFDGAGVPLNNTDGDVTGPGTSDEDEARTNAWLVLNSPTGWSCGYTEMSAADIALGKSCYLDPADPRDTTHNIPYVVAEGTSAYGMGAEDYSYARTIGWLQANSPGGYDCDGHTLTSTDIAEGNTCKFSGTGSSAKSGGSYPTAFQVWKYDAQDLLNVKNGVYNYWEITPTIWQFDLPMTSTTYKKAFMGATYDATTQRIYVGQAFGDDTYPLIHVFSIRPLISAGRKSISFTGTNMSVGGGETTTLTVSGD